MIPSEFPHGEKTQLCNVALILIDVINEMNFPEADDLLVHALPMAKRLAVLKQRCKDLGIPVVYVNDNFGIWRSDFKSVLKQCLRDEAKGKPVAELLKPSADEYFVLKPKHSGFYSTSLEILLNYLHCKTLIVTGVAANICVLFTANDAYMRDFKLIIPQDCVASNTEEETRHALKLMEKILKSDITASQNLDLSRLR